MKTFCFGALLFCTFLTNIGRSQQNIVHPRSPRANLPPENYVRPIDLERFNRSENPESTDAIRSRDLLINAVRYGLKWVKTLLVSPNGLYDPGGTGEGHIRPLACTAVGLATALKTGIYQADATGVPEQEAIQRTCKLIKSIVLTHTSNSDNGWGDSWQSALWAALAGQAAFMMWDHLDPEAQNWSAWMITHEANRFNFYIVPYYKDINGNVQFSGDSKGEENSWNAMILQVAVAMMPDHPNCSLWKRKCVELMISAYARPSDLNKTEVIDGNPLSDWLSGSNLEEDGTLINHGFIHNDYMCTVEQNLRSCLLFSLGDVTIPESACFNADVIYDAFVNLEFEAPPYEPPGGTMFIEDSPEQYYPNGTDWSIYRYDIYYTLDVFARILNFDDYSGGDASSWERLRATRLLNMQNRHSDGRIYATGEWDNYAGKEQLAAWQLSDAYLLKWLSAQGELSSVGSWDTDIPELEIVNNNNDEIIYSEGWIYNSNATGRIDGDEHYTNETGSNAEYSFKGTSVKYIATKFSNRGEADVYIDGEYEATIDLFHPGTLYQQVVFVKSGLSDHWHTIKIICKGTKNPESEDYYIDIDGLIVSDGLNTNTNHSRANVAHLKVFPNPASDVVHFEFFQRAQSQIILNIYDLKGKLLRSFQKNLDSGLQKMEFRIKNQEESLKNGIYVYQLIAGKDIKNGKLVITD